MMFNQIGILEDMLQELERINSLLHCTCETYFNKYRPEASELLKNYKDCNNIIYTIQDLAREQTTTLRSSIEVCYETQVKVRKELLEVIELLTEKEVKKRLEHVMVLLDIADLEEFIRKKGLNQLLEIQKPMNN